MTAIKTVQLQPYFNSESTTHVLGAIVGTLMITRVESGQGWNDDMGVNGIRTLPVSNAILGCQGAALIQLTPHSFQQGGVQLMDASFVLLRFHQKITAGFLYQIGYNSFGQNCRHHRARFPAVTTG